MGYSLTFEQFIPKTGIDAKSVANTTLWTNNGTTNFVVTGASVVCTAATSITIGPTIGIGTAAGTSDIISATAMGALTTASKAFRYSLSGTLTVIAPAGSLFGNVTVAATGTSQTLTINVTGYWT